MSSAPPHRRPEVAKAAGALSAAQLRELVWADPLQRVHAVVQASHVPGLVPRLQAAGGDWDSLWPGALTPSQQASAPWLVALAAGSELAEWLLLEAATDFPEWGVLVSSRLRFLRLRDNLRGLGRVRTPQGVTVPLAWMDPVILSVVLEGADGGQLRELFDGVDSYWLPLQGSWQRAVLDDGRLVRASYSLRAG